jgi:hypothetical protein
LGLGVLVLPKGVVPREKWEENFREVYQLVRRNSKKLTKKIYQ